MPDPTKPWQPHPGQALVLHTDLTSGDPTWCVEIVHDGGTKRVYMTDEHVCYHHGSWNPQTPSQATTAAIDFLVELYRTSLEQKSEKLSAERIVKDAVSEPG